MRLRPVRLLLHVGAAALLASAGVLVAGAPGHADTAARPDSFGGDATASAFQFLADRNPQPTPVADVFHAELPYATTSMDSSGSISATAAALYPGAGFLGAPGLLCQFSADLCKVISNVPRYPFIATASYPTHPDDSADAPPAGSTFQQGPLTVAPSVTAAKATQDTVEATTEAGTTGVEGVVRAGSSTSHSKQAFEGSTLVVTAESAVNGIDLGAGQLHIDQVRSIATARVDGAKVTASSATTTVSGATAGGVPVTIDSTGVHVADSGDDGALQGAVNTALAALDASGIRVRALTPTRLAKDGTASASTGGLLITFAQTVSLPNPPPNPLPAPPSGNGDYAGSVTLAGAGVNAFATPADLVATPELLLPGDPQVSAGGPPQGGAGSPPLSSGQAPAAPQSAEQTPAQATAGADPRTEPAAALGVDLSGKRLRVLALVLLGYPLLVLLTAPLRAPARLPRGL
jgi:hypothetical protein